MQINFFQQLLSKSKAPKTAKTYTNLFGKWKHWAIDNNLSVFPVTPAHFAIYLSELSRKGAHFSTVEQTFAAMLWFNRMLHNEDGSNFAICRLVTDACRRQAAPCGKRKEPLTPEDLNKIANICLKKGTLTCLRLLAIVSVSFAGFLRISELLDLRANDAKFLNDHLEICIRKSKTDVYRNGNTVLIAKTSNLTCPFTALLNYMTFARINFQSEKFIFRTISSRANVEILKKQRLTYTRAREILRACFTEIGLVASKYGTHSLRSGGASAAAANGVTPEELK